MNISIKRFLNVSTDGDVADELGDLRAKMKALADQAAFLEGLLKEKGVTVAEGKRYRVAITYGIETRRTDWHAVADALDAPQPLIDANTSVTLSTRVRVGAHRKGA
jgi:hypothetical protein